MPNHRVAPKVEADPVRAHSDRSLALAVRAHSDLSHARAVLASLGEEDGLGP